MLRKGGSVQRKVYRSGESKSVWDLSVRREGRGDGNVKVKGNYFCRRGDVHI